MTAKEFQCESCGAEYSYDEKRHCFKCDNHLCINCIREGDIPLCEECYSNVFPETYEPMLSTGGKKHLIKNEEEWAYEFKWDGARSLIYYDTKNIKIYSRNLNDVTFRYPEMQELKEALGNNIAVLDGEIVALDENNSPNFKLMQTRMHVSASKVNQVMEDNPAHYYIFDILYLNGEELKNKPYLERRKYLDGLKIKTPHCKLSPYSIGNGEEMMEVAKKHKLEGLVAKKTDSLYLPGQRSNDWLKLKIIQMQEFLIGGWIEETNSSGRVGSILIGYVNGKGKINYAGKVGTGFNNEDHKMLVKKFRKNEIKQNPFNEKLRPKQGWHFVAPKLIAEIEYRRWFEGGNVQQAAYKGLRYDKNPMEVVREDQD